MEELGYNFNAYFSELKLELKSDPSSRKVIEREKKALKFNLSIMFDVLLLHRSNGK